ncbi:DoxX family protein [Myxococcota bacterium]|nr:DoxX family protein [Myxococcota bacterium]MBU1430297.1 DoxX family protein [Myxococcota bacterium]MBU1896261.1 DoxX family protein [Myxococcota bacterium]
MRRLIPALDWLALPARVYLGGVFLYACWFKIIDPSAFALSVATYQILPLGLINLTALLLPWLELVVGALLILGLWTRANALLCAAMLIVFIIAITSALYFDLRLSCGCFASGEAAHEISLETIWRDLGWLALALLLVWRGAGRLGLDHLIQRSPQ